MEDTYGIPSHRSNCETGLITTNLWHQVSVPKHIEKNVYKVRKEEDTPLNTQQDALNLILYPAGQKKAGWRWAEINTLSNHSSFPGHIPISDGSIADLHIATISQGFLTSAAHAN